MSFHSKLNVIILIGFLISFSGCDRKGNVNEPDDGLAPVIPSGFRIYYANDGLIELIWISNEEADLKGYNLYKSINDTLSFKLAGFTSGDYFVDDSLDYDSTYYYYITAIDRQNRESSPTSVISAKPFNKFVPLIPRNVQINARNWNNKKEILLWWDRSQEPDIKVYNIYRGLSEDFESDSTTFLDFSSSESYIDSNDLNYYQTYFYKITAVDKGGLESSSSNEVFDQILETPTPVFPSNNTIVDYFEVFKIRTVGAPAVYRLILQSNQYFGELWSTRFSSATINDTIEVKLGYRYLERNKTYYWRVAAYSENNTEPNSISDLYKFTIKP